MGDFLIITTPLALFVAGGTMFGMALWAENTDPSGRTDGSLPGLVGLVTALLSLGFLAGALVGGAQ